jgi:hypothetical protein
MQELGASRAHGGFESVLPCCVYLLNGFSPKRVFLPNQLEMANKLVMKIYIGVLW